MNKTFMKKRVSPTNPKDANPAAMPVKTAVAGADNARCLMRFVQTAANRAKCLSSPETTALFIAAIVFQIKDNDKHENTPSGVFFCI